MRLAVLGLRPVLTLGGDTMGSLLFTAAFTAAKPVLEVGLKGVRGFSAVQTCVFQ